MADRASSAGIATWSRSMRRSVMIRMLWPLFSASTLSAHTDACFTGHRHRAHQELEVFLRVAEGLLAVGQRLGELAGAAMHVDRVEPDAHVLDPLPIRLGEGELVLQLLVVDDAALLEVDEEH